MSTVPSATAPVATTVVPTAPAAPTAPVSTTTTPAAPATSTAVVSTTSAAPGAAQVPAVNVTVTPAAPYKTSSSFYNNRVWQYNYTGSAYESLVNKGYNPYAQAVASAVLHTFGFIIESIINLPGLVGRGFEYLTGRGAFAKSAEEAEQAKRAELRQPFVDALVKVQSLTPSGIGVTVDAAVINPATNALDQAAAAVTAPFINASANDIRVTLARIAGEKAALVQHEKIKNLKMPVANTLLQGSPLNTRKSLAEFGGKVLFATGHDQLCQIAGNNVANTLSQSLLEPGLITVQKITDSAITISAEVPGLNTENTIWENAKTASASHIAEAVRAYNEFSNPAHRATVEGNMRANAQTAVDQETAKLEGAEGLRNKVADLNAVIATLRTEITALEALNVTLGEVSTGLVAANAQRVQQIKDKRTLLANAESQRAPAEAARAQAQDNLDRALATRANAATSLTTMLEERRQLIAKISPSAVLQAPAAVSAVTATTTATPVVVAPVAPVTTTAAAPSTATATSTTAAPSTPAATPAITVDTLLAAQRALRANRSSATTPVTAPSATPSASTATVVPTAPTAPSAPTDTTAPRRLNRQPVGGWSIPFTSWIIGGSN